MKWSHSAQEFALKRSINLNGELSRPELMSLRERKYSKNEKQKKNDGIRWFIAANISIKMLSLVEILDQFYWHAE